MHGLTDDQKRALGTNLDDPHFKFSMNDAKLPAAGKIQLTWPSATGVLYPVWQSGDLVGWTMARDGMPAETPPDGQFENDLILTNGIFRVETEI